MIGIIKTISQGVSKNGRAFRKVELIEGGSIYIWQANVGENIQIGQQYDFTLDGTNTSFLNATEIIPVIGSEVVPPEPRVLDTGGAFKLENLPSSEDKKQAYWAEKDLCIKRQSALKSAVAFLGDTTEATISLEDVIASAKRFFKYIEEGE